MRTTLALAFLLAAPVLAAEAPAPGFPLGQLAEKVACAADPGETYTLYLPSGYKADRAWPILYAMDPRSRGTHAAERFRAAAEKHGYIVASSNNTLSDTTISPNVKAFQAMWTDTHARFRIDDRRVYLAGFSGTVRSAVFLARGVPGSIAGIIGAGAGFPYPDPPKKGDPFVFFGTIGDKDFNWYEMMDLEPKLQETGITHRIEVFDGVHQWPPEPLAIRALDWMELQAMKAGTRPKDAALVDALWKDAQERARAAEAAGDLWQAWRLWSGAAEDFTGLREAASLEEAAAKAAKLKANRAFQRDLKEREARLRKDKEFLAMAPMALATPDPWSAVSTLKIQELRKKAKSARSADERLGAQRVLNTLAVQTGYYLPQKFTESKDWDRVIFFFTIAAEIDPEEPSVYYGRAAAYARKDDRKKAVADLRRAVEKGWKDLPGLEKDEAFAGIRQDEAYQKLVKSLAAGTASGGE
jgi:tetratricopeptide (TPR) repeat protein